MNQQINISLFRVSSDGKFLDVIVSCPRGFQFTSFMLKALYKLNGEDKEFSYDIGDKIFHELKDANGHHALSHKNHWTMRIDIAKDLNIGVPAIYVGTFNAKEIQCECNKKPLIPIEDLDGPMEHHHHHHHDTDHTWLDHKLIELPEAEAICSDVSAVYLTMMDGLINEPGCAGIPDDVVRNYLILFAHQEAMRLGHISDAILYFNMINNNFTKCGNFERSGKGPSCGCGGSPKREIVVKTSSCGCSKR